MDIDPSISAPPDLTEAQVIAWLAAKCRALHSQADAISLHVHPDYEGRGMAYYFAHAGGACVSSTEGLAEIPAKLSEAATAEKEKKRAELAQAFAEVAS